MSWLPRFSVSEGIMCFAWGHIDSRCINLSWGRLHLEFMVGWETEGRIPISADDCAEAWVDHHYPHLLEHVNAHHLIDAYVAGFEMGRSENA